VNVSSSLTSSSKTMLPSAPQLLAHVAACGAQGCTVNWPDVARRALASGFQGVGPPELRPHD